jgi:DNA-binding NarL/FixJ family response regulator
MKDFLACSEKERVCKHCRTPRPKFQAGYPTLSGKRLTPREKQVVAQVSQGRLNKEIAFSLHLSDGTIKVYCSKIFAKVGVSNRTELAMWWVSQRDKETA